MVAAPTEFVDQLARMAKPWQDRILQHPLFAALDNGVIPRANLGELNKQMYLRIQGTQARILRGAMAQPAGAVLERRLRTMAEEFGHDTLLLDAAADYGLTLADMEGAIPTPETEIQDLYQRPGAKPVTPADGQIFAFLVEGIFNEVCGRIANALRTRYAATPVMLAFYEVHIVADVMHGAAGRAETAALRLAPEVARQATFNARRTLEYRDLFYNGILRVCLAPPPPLPAGARPTPAFLEMLDEALAPLRARLLDHPLLRAVEAGELPRPAVAAFLVQLHRLNQRVPFVLLQGLMRHPDHALAGAYARATLQKARVHRGLVDWGRSVGLDEAAMDAAEPSAETQGFGLWLQRLAEQTVPADQEGFAYATFGVWPELCRRLGAALAARYGAPEGALGYFAFYGRSDPDPRAMAARVLETYLPEREDFQRRAFHAAQRGLEYWLLFLDGCHADLTDPLRRATRPWPVLRDGG